MFPGRSPAWEPGPSLPLAKPIGHCGLVELCPCGAQGLDLCLCLLPHPAASPELATTRGDPGWLVSRVPRATWLISRPGSFGRPMLLLRAHLSTQLFLQWRFGERVLSCLFWSSFSHDLQLSP